MILQYALERAPDLPDVPMMAELGLDARATAALKLFAAGNAMGRSIFATPGIPAERAAALRKAFMDTMDDPELVAFTRERNIDLGPTLGRGAGADRDGDAVGVAGDRGRGEEGAGGLISGWQCTELGRSHSSSGGASSAIGSTACSNGYRRTDCPPCTPRPCSSTASGSRP